jgi:hypothetical protein
VRLTVTFSESPTVTEFCAVLDGIARAYPGCTMVEPTDQLTVVIDARSSPDPDVTPAH